MAISLDEASALHLRAMRHGLHRPVDGAMGAFQEQCARHLADWLEGGEDRAFTVPLSRFVQKLFLYRREGDARRFEPGCPWVFPARDRAGRPTHVQEPKEQRLVDGKKRTLLPSPHRLRDIFATAAYGAVHLLT